MTSPLVLKIKNRELVVPWSMAPMKARVEVPFAEGIAQV